MADTNIPMAGLFGIDPAQFMAQQEKQDEASAYQRAQMPGWQPSVMSGMQLNANVGRGVGSLLGVQDPELAANAKLRALQQQALQDGIDPSTPEGMQQFSQILMQAGLPEKAMLAAQKAQELNTKGLEASVKASTIAKNLAAAQKSSTPAVKDHTPEVQAAQIRLDNYKKMYGDVAGAEKFAEDEQNRKDSTQMRGQDIQESVRRDLAQVSSNERKAKVDSALAEKDAMAQQARDRLVAAYDTTLETLDKIRNHPGKWSGVGLGGDTASAIPGTDAKAFRSQLNTFKAQGFIQQIKDLKSAGNGASGLGALSDAEGARLVAAVGALDPQVSADEFDKQLNDITKTITKNRALAAKPTVTQQARMDMNKPKPAFSREEIIQELNNRRMRRAQ